MDLNELKAIHESFHSKLSDKLGDPFYKRVSQDWLLIIANYLTTKKGIVLNKGNILAELDKFCMEMNEKRKSGFEVCEEICLDKQTDTAFPYMTEETVNKSFSYFKSVVIVNCSAVEKNNVGNSDEFMIFKQELQDLIYNSAFMFNVKTYSFEKNVYPDIEAIVMLSRFCSNNPEKYDLMIKKVFEDLQLGKMSIYMDRISSYHENPNDENYKAVGKIIVPVIEQVIDEMNTIDLVQEVHSSRFVMRRNKSTSVMKWNWR